MEAQITLFTMLMEIIVKSHPVQARRENKRPKQFNTVGSNTVEFRLRVKALLQGLLSLKLIKMAL